VQGLEPHAVALRGATSGKTGPAEGTMTGKGRRKKVVRHASRLCLNEIEAECCKGWNHRFR
jgi:hypothetical protein